MKCFKQLKDHLNVSATNEKRYKPHILINYSLDECYFQEAC